MTLSICTMYRKGQAQPCRLGVGILFPEKVTCLPVDGYCVQ